MAELFARVREVNTTGFGDTGMRLGDLDNDGEMECVFFQARDCHIPRMSAGGYRHEKQVHCITAMKLDGDVMWQDGAPLGIGYWAMHGVAAAVSDIDANGKPEIVYITEREGRSYLRILEGDRGYYRKEVETGPNCVLQLVDIRGLGARRDILVSTFVNPIYIYADDLECLWNCHFYGGAGHHHDSYDMDGDGKEELYIGYCCVRADGIKIWWRPDLEPHLEEMKRAPHVDTIQITDLGQNGEADALLIAGKDLVCLDARTGADKWIYPGRHIQTATVGKFLPDQPGLQIYVAERRPLYRAYMLDSTGHELWRQEDTSYGQTVHVAGVGDCIFIYPPGRRPTLLNGEGKVLQELDMVPKQEDRFDDGDTGTRAVQTIADVDDDGKQEILFYNRTRMWLYHQV